MSRRRDGSVDRGELDPVVARPGLLILSGSSLPVLAWLVGLAQRERRRNGLEPSQVLDVLAAAARQAAAGHSDTADTRPADDAGGVWLTVEEAAARLRVSPRHVRRLAPGLGGRRVAGRWQIDPDAVAEHLDGKEPE